MDCASRGCDGRMKEGEDGFHVEKKCKPRSCQLCALRDGKYPCFNDKDNEHGKNDGRCAGNAGACAGIRGVF